MTDQVTPEQVLFMVAEQAHTIELMQTDLADLTEAVATLNTRLHGQQGEGADKPAPWTWRYATAEQAEALWEERRVFVDFLVDRYGLGKDSELWIPPCWWLHSYAVEELTALMVAWKSAYLGVRKLSSEPMNWHDRWLWPLLHRLRQIPHSWASCIPPQGHRGRSGPPEVVTSFTDFVAADVQARKAQRLTAVPSPGAGETASHA